MWGEGKSAIKFTRLKLLNKFVKNILCLKTKNLNLKPFLRISFLLS